MPKRNYTHVGASGETSAEYARDLRVRRLTDERLAHLIDHNRRRLVDLEAEQRRRSYEKCEFTWSWTFGDHYCGLSEPHTVHVCGEQGCATTFEPSPQPKDGES